MRTVNKKYAGYCTRINININSDFQALKALRRNEINLADLNV